MFFNSQLASDDKLKKHFHHKRQQTFHSFIHSIHFKQCQWLLQLLRMAVSRQLPRASHAPLPNSLLSLRWHWLHPREPQPEEASVCAEPWFSKPFRVPLQRTPRKWNAFPPKNRFFSLWASFPWVYSQFAFSGTYPLAFGPLFYCLFVKKRTCCCFRLWVWLCAPPFFRVCLVLLF